MRLPVCRLPIPTRIGSLVLAAMTVAGGCDPDPLPEAPVGDPRADESAPDDDSEAEVRVEIEMRMDNRIPEAEIDLVDPSTHALPGRLTPNRVWLRVFQVQVSTDPYGCTNPVTIASDPSPAYEDFSDGTSLVTGTAPVGAYGCVIVTIDDSFWWRDDTGICANGTDTHQYLFTPDGRSEVDLVLTTADPWGLSPSLDGKVVYPMDEGYFHDGTVNRTALIVDAFSVVDAVECELDEAPRFSFGPI